MANSHRMMNGDGRAEIGHNMLRNSPTYQTGLRGTLPWLDLRVFYVRVSNCEIDDTAPEFLTLNHVPLNRDTLLEVNGVRTSIYSDGVSNLLRRDRLDKKSEEVTFVSTDNIRMTGSVKFEVFDKTVLILSGTLEFCTSNGFLEDLENHGQCWRMNCESNIIVGTGFLKENQYPGLDSSPSIEVYVAGCFSGNPIILTKTLQLNHKRKQPRKGILEAIPEYEHADYLDTKHENEDYSSIYSRMEILEGEDGELSWFNSGVRVGVGIGLSICLGIGIGVGLLVRTYQGTARNFRRRLL